MNLGIKTVEYAAFKVWLASHANKITKTGGITVLDDNIAVVNSKKIVPSGSFVGKSIAVPGTWDKYTAATFATLDTGVVANNNAVTFTSKLPGVAGHSIKASLIDPAGNNKLLEVNLINDEIRISLATSGAGAITTTGAELIAAVNSAIIVKDLVTASNTGASTGAAAVVAKAIAALAGAADSNVSLAQGDFGILFDDVDVTDGNAMGAVLFGGEVIASRLPVAPSTVVKAALPNVFWK
jgi:hypothetical protein